MITMQKKSLYFFLSLLFICFNGCKIESKQPIRTLEEDGKFYTLNILYKVVEIEGKKWMASYSGKGFWVLAGPIEE